MRPNRIRDGVTRLFNTNERRMKSFEFVTAFEFVPPKVGICLVSCDNGAFRSGKHWKGTEIVVNKIISNCLQAAPGNFLIHGQTKMKANFIGTLYRNYNIVLRY